jgi:hypothetical protein
LSAQALINIIQNPVTYNRLRALIKLVNDKQFTRKEIYQEVKKLELKPYEFFHIVKYVNEPDLLMNELATLELIADNLLDEYNGNC